MATIGERNDYHAFVRSGTGSVQYDGRELEYGGWSTNSSLDGQGTWLSNDLNISGHLAATYANDGKDVHYHLTDGLGTKRLTASSYGAAVGLDAKGVNVVSHGMTAGLIFKVGSEARLPCIGCSANAEIGITDLNFHPPIDGERSFTSRWWAGVHPPGALGRSKETQQKT